MREMTSIRFLSKDNLKSIHQSTMEVLRKTGIQVKNETALSLLKENGCT
ncbi:MAG: Trimethylamine methyltransferase MttB, partial [Candidatus Thorarchaeota archaeon AB_25]